MRHGHYIGALTMSIDLTARKVFIALCLIIAFLVTANVTGIIMKYWLDHDHVFGLVKFFDLNTENNAPSFYSALAIIFCSILLTFICLSQQGVKRIQWGGLALLFFYLGLDEALQLHDRLDIPLRTALGTSGVLRHAWIIPYGIMLLALLAIYGKFLLQLDKATRIRFIASGIVFVVGAIGFEILSGLREAAVGYKNAGYAFIYTVEEFLEMMGIALFARALVIYLEENVGQIQLEFGEQS